VKILSRWFILSFLLTLLAITMALEPNHEIYTSYELIHETETIEDAHELASVFDLSLVEHTNYGFSIFESSDPERKEQLLYEGFELNQKLKTTANFPIFSDEDPYLDDQYAIDMMDVDLAWSIKEGVPNYLIAVIDTGIDTIDLNTEFIDEGAKASYGLRRLDVEVISDNVDVSIPGVYEIVYYTTYLGFEKTITRKVTVIDDQIPDVYLNVGLDTIFVGDPWIDAGIDSDEEVDVSVSGYVNVNIAGEYVITYMINDGELTLYRYVNVIEKA